MAALIALALALALTEDLGDPFEAMVLREHVMLGLNASPEVLYEVLERGRELSDSDLSRHEPYPPGGPTRESGAVYLPYYLDNLAARFAEAGDAEAAEGIFLKALELGPQAVRVYFSYGNLPA